MVRQLTALFFLSMMAGTAASQPLYGDAIDFGSLVRDATCLAVADINGDGHLDVILGENGGAALWLNDGNGNLSASPWRPSDSQGLPTNDGVLSISVGDIDRDGDIDVVLGTTLWLRLYENVEGTLEPLSSFPEVIPIVANGIGLGDVDGDGDLDLVTAGGYTATNIGRPNTVYRNDGGVFTPQAAWSQSDASRVSTAVALGDVNGDGLVDAVFGNQDGANRLYLGDAAGLLENTFSWEDTDLLPTKAVALGDISGDGFFDLVCANGNLGGTLYLGTGAAFNTTADWAVSLAAPGTRTAVTIGDVDLDGDLDVAFGLPLGNQVHLNTGTMLDSLPAWTANDLLETHAMALADLDGEGDLELIGAGDAGASQLYENITRYYTATPQWTRPGPPKDARDIELVDVDLDGDLELFVARFGLGTANTYEPSELYEFDETTFLDSNVSAASIWIDQKDPEVGVNPPDHPPSWDGAFGDYDGDEYPDLLIVNGRFEHTVYRNDAGTLRPRPILSGKIIKPEIVPVMWCTWADFGGDGYPDILLGSNTLLYGDQWAPNHDGTLPDTISAASFFDFGDPSYNIRTARAMTIVDIDNDGDLDYLAGGVPGLVVYRTASGAPGVGGVSIYPMNTGMIAGVAAGYFTDDDLIDFIVTTSNGVASFMVNEGGRLAQDESWVPTVANHFGAEPGDINGDGFTDVVAMRQEAQVGRSRVDLFIAKGHTLPETPAPITINQAYVRRLAVGDIDGDGDLDIATAGGGSHSSDIGPVGNARAWLSRRTPVFKNSFSMPANQLPASAVVLRTVSITPTTSDNTYEVTFSLLDVDSDPVRVTLEYQYEGEGQWRPMQLGSLPATFASSPGGTRHTLAWDVIEVEFTQRPIVVRLQATDVQSSVGTSSQHVSRFIKPVGRVVPKRPSISLVTPQALFPTVTVGDTTCFDVVVRNIGNEPLDIRRVELPSLEMELLSAVPLTLAPGASDTLQICFQPTVELPSPADILIHSNDPTRPSESVLVVVDVRTLQATTRLFSGDDEAIPIDQDATVVVTPFPQVNVEGGWLYHRAAGDAVFADSIALEPLETELFAIIPAAKLVETGLEYYIRIENSGVLGFDPPGAPDSLFSQAVGAPTRLMSVALPNAGQGFGEGQPVGIRAVLPEGSRFNRGWIYYRAGASADYDTTALSGSGASAKGQIPATATGVRGVDYWIEVETASTRLTDPAVLPSSSPRHLRVTVPDLQEPSAHPGLEYRMFSFPLEVQGTLLGAIADDLGGTDITQSRVATWDGTKYVYGNAIGAARHGAAYWLITLNEHRLDTAPATSISTDMSVLFEVQLSPGWNMVGQPFPFDVAWNRVTLEDATAVPGPPQTYIRSGYVSVTLLEPFSGYWVHNRADSVVSIWIPPVEGTPSPTPTVSLDWFVRVTASGEDASTQSLILAVSEKATDKRDSIDRLLPPAAPDQPMEIYAVDEAGRSYSRDVRAATMEPGWGHAWAFDVAVSKNGRVPVTLALDLSSVPNGAEVLLLDREVKRTHDVNAASRIEVFVTGSTRKTSPDDTRFILLVGDAQYIEENRSLLPALPTRTALHQNFPNPFNPTTVIRYELAGSAHVSLRVYDVRGALVRTLEDRNLPAGRYEVGWNGVDNRGSQVASGIYFYRLVSSEGIVLTRKMVLLK